MSTLDEIVKKAIAGKKLTPIELAIHWVWNDTHTNMGIAYEAAAELTAMQARIEKLESVAEKLANIIQWAMDDEEDFTYSTEGMAAIAELDALKGDE